MGESETILPQMVLLQHVEMMRQFMLEQLTQLHPLPLVRYFGIGDKVPQVGLGTVGLLMLHGIFLLLGRGAVDCCK